MPSRIIVLIISLFISSLSFSQETFEIEARISADNSLKEQLQPKGRLLLFISEQASPEPRQQTWPKSSALGEIRFKKAPGAILVRAWTET